MRKCCAVRGESHSDELFEMFESRALSSAVRVPWAGVVKPGYTCDLAAVWEGEGGASNTKAALSCFHPTIELWFFLVLVVGGGGGRGGGGGGKGEPFHSFTRRRALISIHVKHTGGGSVHGE